MVLRITGLMALLLSAYIGIYFFFGVITTIVVVAAMSFISIMTVAISQRHTDAYNLQQQPRRNARYSQHNNFNDDTNSADSTDIMTDPIYSNIEGNIYHSSLDD